MIESVASVSHRMNVDRVSLFHSQRERRVSGGPDVDSLSLEQEAQALKWDYTKQIGLLNRHMCSLVNINLEEVLEVVRKNCFHNCEIPLTWMSLLVLMQYALIALLSGSVLNILKLTADSSCSSRIRKSIVSDISVYFCVDDFKRNLQNNGVDNYAVFELIIRKSYLCRYLDAHETLLARNFRIISFCNFFVSCSKETFSTEPCRVV